MSTKSTLLPGMIEWTLKQNNRDRNSSSFGCGYLFLDVCGFTKLTELVSSQGHYGVEIITNLLNQYFDLLSDKISEYGGQILKFEGDAVLAAFPQPHAGCLAKLETCMQEFKQALDALNLNLQKDYGSSLAYHGSIGYGESQMIILGCPEVHLDYFVYSPVLSELYRRCELAGENEILAVPVKDSNALEQLMLNGACYPTQMPQYAHSSYDAAFFPEEILSRGSSEDFSGELRNSAILFIGVEAEKYIRAGNYTLINDYYCAIQKIVYHLDGMINKIDYTDKGMILLISFGILHTHVDDIERAITAANQINSITSPLNTKIGLTYSNLYAGILGAKSRHEYGIIGSGVNVAARLMSSAKYGQIVFTKDILSIVESRFDTKFLRQEFVKGIKNKLEFYLIVRELPEYVNSYLRQYHDKPQIAYQQETAAIRAKLEKQALNQVLLLGEHGTGKSFLGWQLLRPYYEKHDKLAVFVIDEYNRHDALILLHKLLAKGMGAYDPLADPAALKQYLLSILSERDAKILMSSLGLSLGANPVTDDSGRNKELQLSSLYSSFEKLSAAYDVILIDNVHWLDDLSQELLIRRSEAKERKAPLLILTGIPAFSARVQVKNSRTATLTLGNLENSNAYSLIHSRIPNITHQAGDMIIELAGGNPSFIIELCAQVNSLFPDPDLPITAPNIQEFQNKGLLPYSVENLFIIKYEALSDEAKDIVKKASIIGKGFTLNEIVETHNHTIQEDIKDIINELKDKEIIDITDLAPEVQYLFSNVLMRQAVYATILLSEKRELHNRIAEYYKMKYQDRIEQYSELLAYHFNLGANRPQALLYSKMAAQRHQNINNHGEAVFFYQIAQQNSDDPSEKSVLALCIADSQFYLGEKDKACSTLAEVHPEDLQDREQITKYHFLKTRAMYLGSEYEKLLNYLAVLNDFEGKYGNQLRIYQLDSLLKLQRMEEFNTLYARVKADFHHKAITALGIKEPTASLSKLLAHYRTIPEAEISEDMKFYLYLLLKLEAIYLNQLIATGHYKQALKTCKFQYDLAKALQDQLSMRIACGCLGIIYTRMGNTDKAHKAYVEAIDIADRISDRFGYAKVLADLGTLHRRMGDHAKALINYQRSLKVFEALGNEENQSIVLHNLGEMYQWEEKYDLALKYYRKELKVCIRIGDLVGISFAQDAIGDILYKSKAYAKAKALYHKNLKLQEQIGDREGISHTYGNLGNVAKDEGDFVLAHDYYTKNIQMSEEMGDTDGNGRAYYNMGALYEEMNDIPRAVEYVTTALQRFQQSGTTQLIQAAKDYLKLLQAKL